MTITEMARQLKVSRNTLYRRIKENQLDMDKLREHNGQLTQYGMSVIAGLFDDVSREMPEDVTLQVTSDVSDTRKMPDIDTDGVSNVSQLAIRVAQLQERCDSLTRENDRLQDIIADLRQQRDTAQEEARRQKEQAATENAHLIAALEAAQQMQQRLLPEARREKRGWLARLFQKDNAE